MCDLATKAALLLCLSDGRCGSEGVLIVDDATVYTCFILTWWYGGRWKGSRHTAAKNVS